jgi:hypothetical protein
MWTVLKVASGVTAIAVGFILFRWLEWLPGKNAEWGPFTLPALCITWVAVFGIGAVGFLAPDFIARNWYKLEQPMQLRFSLRTLMIAMTLITSLLGMIAFFVGMRRSRFDPVTHAEIWLVIATVVAAVPWVINAALRR